ncbi:hypothetical protein [Nonomuraea typhae]|uniref:hypothetical protein n=1 Tax=Nonomuraea typhae TaxID=2603600 RepID=UPI0012FCD4B4|nr:hypothetical protein [Nonomuraea typhae]
MRLTPERAAYIRGLRRLADLLEANPELERPETGRCENTPVSVELAGLSACENAVKWVRIMTGPRITHVSQYRLELAGRVEGLLARLVLWGVPVVDVPATTKYGTAFEVVQIRLPDELLQVIDLGEWAHHIYPADAPAPEDES